MPKIGILYGMETTFPAAFVERINSKKIPGISAEHIRVGGVRIAQDTGYAVIVDRVSQDIEFYRAYLKNAALKGTLVLNDPAHWSAHDKFTHYALAETLGLAVPKTVVLPQKSHPPGTTQQSLRNLMFPLNWDEIFDYVGFPAFLKPLGRGGWLNVQRVESRDQFFHAYDQTGPACMLLQEAVQYQAHHRCYVIGDNVRVLRYQPHQPAHLRYVADVETSKSLCDRLAADGQRLSNALGYNINAVEFAVKDDVPYVMDSFHPAPDADLHSVGQANFEWIVAAYADLAVQKAESSPAYRLAAASN
jgi:glutathione synthase/RimK-type ligase-like ATP-grasp enzyme